MPTSVSNRNRCFVCSNSAADVTAAVYPVKQINWDKMAGAVQAGRSPLESATLSYVVEREPGQEMVVRDGFVKSRYAGTGFLLIRRGVLEAMIEHYPELRYTHEHRASDPLGGQSMAFRAVQLHGRPKHRVLPQ